MWLWIAAACSTAPPPAPPTWNAVFSGAKALEAGDVHTFRAAMRVLSADPARPPYHDDPVADAMRQSAAVIADAPIAALPLGLYTVASACGACHRTHGVATTALPSPDDPLILATAGVVWDDERAWTRGSTALTERGLVGAGGDSPDIPRRGLALVNYLRQFVPMD